MPDIFHSNRQPRYLRPVSILFYGKPGSGKTEGNIIYHEGDVCENIGIVISGKIDIISYSFEGKEQLINTLKAGEIFGNNLLFSSEPLYRGDVVAKEKSVVAFINKENLVFLLQNNAEFLNLYLKAQSDKAKALTARIQLLSFTNAEERLFYYDYFITRVKTMVSSYLKM